MSSPKYGALLAEPWTANRMKPSGAPEEAEGAERPREADQGAAGARRTGRSASRPARLASLGSCRARRGRAGRRKAASIELPPIPCRPAQDDTPLREAFAAATGSDPGGNSCPSREASTHACVHPTMHAEKQARRKAGVRECRHAGKPGSRKQSSGRAGM